MFEDMARRYGFLALLCALLFAVLFSQNGVLEYVGMKRQINAKDASVKRLVEENISLKAQIDRLQKDDQYLEDVARQKFGFIKEGEKVYRIEKK
jgi:cell division protein FtsB